MMVNNTTSWNSSDNRKVAIKVTGIYRQDLTPKSTYTIIVPYCRLSQTIQQINRLGGQIIEVSVRSSVLIDPPQISPTPQIKESEIMVDNSAVEPISNVFEEVPKTALDENLPEAEVSPETLNSPSDEPKALSKTKTKLRKKKSRLKEAIAKKSKDKKSKKKSKNEK